MSISLPTLFGLLLSLIFLGGIHLMNSPRTAAVGNMMGAFGMLAAIIMTLISAGIFSIGLLWISLAVGGIIGYFLALRVTMLQMPQMVALLNGFGGGASAAAAFVVINGFRGDFSTLITATLAIVVGGVTFSGSMVAALKLDRKITQRPKAFPGQSALNLLVLGSSLLLVAATPFVAEDIVNTAAILILTGSLVFGVFFTIRIGGADMPIAISLLNSLSGLAASIAGFAVRDPLLVATGAIVGSAGLILTRIMCGAMNRSLLEILMGGAAVSYSPSTSIPGLSTVSSNDPSFAESENDAPDQTVNAIERLQAAKTVIIIPGYGMALSQAQNQVKSLSDFLEKGGKEVRFAIHPVAGRMPGHMNVLLAEVDVPYEKLFEMEEINPRFPETDVAIIVGANDVVNPAASTAQGTPIYGMPILDAGDAKFLIIFNKDLSPGYAGVSNPLYNRNNVALFLGDAAERIEAVMQDLKEAATEKI